VEGINMRVHHEKPTQENPQGGRLKREASIHVSNVMVIDPTTDEPTRIGRKRIEEEGGGRWVRYSKKSGELIDK
jgi:large subunit ribosomal protein L24